MFPSNKNEFLTMLYLKNQDTSNWTPEYFVQKYEEVLKQVTDKINEINMSKNPNNR